MHIARFNYSTKLFGVELLDFFNTDDITSHEVIFWDLDETMKKLQKQMILIKDRIGSESDASKASEGFRKHLLFRNEQFNSFFNKKGLIIMPLTNYSWSNDESMRDVLANMGLGFLVDKSIKLKPLKGNKVKAVASFDAFEGLLGRSPDCFRYTHVLQSKIGIPVLTTLNNDYVVGVMMNVDKGAVLLIPPFNSPDDIFRAYGKEVVLSCINRFNMDRLSQARSVDFTFPDWVGEISIGNESTFSGDLNDKLAELCSLKDSIQTIESELNDLGYYKRLICTDGSDLETTVKKTLEFMGFNTLSVSTNRADLLFEIGNTRVVFEVKGVGGSAAERHASQLEKWVNEEHDDNLGLPKGILLVNTFKNLPISERTEPSFPNQMLNFSEKRDHCLMTGYDLLQLLSLFMKGEKSKEQIAELLISTVGILKIN
tara:strand:+ start:309 stop:1592 length:1284 start_codon:yes stop_codon:yes gene_type:complete